MLLVAGAGFGKTVALAQALERGGRSVAWVSCDGVGGDPGRLLGRVVDAVRTAVPGSVDVIAERLAGAREPVDAEAAAAVVAAELRAILVDPLVVVFDDAEALDDAPDALAVVRRLLEADAPELRVAIAARRRPALRSARAAATGALLEIGPAELVFSAAECAEIVASASGRAPEPDEIEAVLAATEGWPLGVGLAAGSDSAPAPSQELLRAYFEEEILEPLDDDERAALLAASVAPDLGVAGAAGIALPDGVPPGLVRSGSATTTFHPLLAEFLRERHAATASAEHRARVSAAIAGALVAAGRGADAVDHFIAAGDWDATADTIAAAGGRLVRTSPGTVGRWLAQLPPEHRRRPDIELLAGAIAHGAGRFDDAVEACRAAVDAFAAPDAPATLRFAALFTLVDAQIAGGDLAGALECAAALDDPAAEGDLAACAVGAVAGAAAARLGRFMSGRELLERILADPAGAVFRPASPGQLAYYHDLPSGRLDDALRNVHAGCGALESADPFGRLPYFLAFAAVIHEQRGELDDALAVAGEAREHAEAAGLSQWVGVVVATRTASIRAQLGDVAGAERDLALVPAGWRSWGAWFVEVTRASVAAQRGDSQAALAAAERALLDVARWPYLDRTQCAELLAPALARSGHAGRARAIVEAAISARPAPEPGAVDRFSTARLHTLLAWLRYDEGDDSGAVEALVEAWAQAGAEPRHVVRCEWPRVERVLWAALAAGAIEPGAAIGAIAAARPGGAALGAFMAHPVPAVRRAAVLTAVTAGHPDGYSRAQELASDPDPDVAHAATAALARVAREPPPLAFRLLGGFELRRGSWVVDETTWERRVAERIVRLLVVSGGAVSEDDLFEAFWPQRPAASARRGLQVAISAARAVLDPPGAATSHLEAGERVYRLHLHEADRVDAIEFERAAGVALGTAAGAGRGAALVAAVQLWGGEPLPQERYSDWAIPWRERLLDRYGEVLAALADDHAARGDAAAAAAAARRLVDLDPLNEGAQRRLIVAYARGGRRAHALRQFLACRRALVEQLGVEPGDETAALQRRLLAGEPL